MECDIFPSVLWHCGTDWKQTFDKSLWRWSWYVLCYQWYGWV